MSEHKSDIIQQIDEYLAQSRDCESSAPAKACEYAALSLRLAREHNLPSYIWRSVRRYVQTIFRYRLHGELGEKDIQEAIRCAKAVGEEQEALQLYNYMGSFYRIRGRFSEAVDVTQKCLELSKAYQDKYCEMHSYGNLGRTYYEIGEYDRAYEYHLFSLQIAEEINELTTIQTQMNSIGTIYHKLGRYEDSLVYFERTLEICRLRGDLYSIANNLSNIGDVYRGLHRYDEALAYLNEALSIAQIEGFSSIKTLAMANLALVFEGLEQYDEALHYCGEALADLEKTDRIPFTADVRTVFARIKTKQGNYEEALELLEKSRLVAESMSEKHDLLTIVYYNLAQACEGKGDIAAAYHWYKLYVAAQAAIHQEEKERDIARQERVYALQKAERARTLLEKQLLQSEHNALRAQINPHFLFNALNSIQSLLAESHTEEALRYLSRFARLMRCILDNSRSKSVPLALELETYKLYIEIEQLRFRNKFEYVVEVEGDINTADMDIPPMIAQPFIENAIWHGLLPKAEGARLCIRIKALDERRYVMEIEDNGIGRLASMSSKKSSSGHRSAGIAIIEERLSLLSDLLGVELSAEIIDLQEQKHGSTGTRVRLVLPIEALS